MLLGTSDVLILLFICSVPNFQVVRHELRDGSSRSLRDQNQPEPELDTIHTSSDSSLHEAPSTRNLLLKARSSTQMNSCIVLRNTDVLIESNDVSFSVLRERPKSPGYSATLSITGKLIHSVQNNIFKKMSVHSLTIST